jgi:hypothetical protein
MIGREETTMPNPLSISISNDTPHPNGNAAVMSKTSANGNSNQATWTASDDDYDVSLPASTWDAPPGESLDFTVEQGATSAVYTLKSNAPTGLQSYSIATDEGDLKPKVLIQP